MGNHKNIADTSLEEYDQLMNTNMRTTFIFSKHVVPQMLLQKQGTILMISSMAGLYGFASQAVYCASKFAQVAFAQSLDKELRPSGIKVGANCRRGVRYWNWPH
jgi:3-oxoacyl-[acyl-carrier protein] reductase